MDDAIVVGAGQAGLGISRHLARLGVRHVVLERGLIGETWRTQRWDAFTLNTPNWLNRLPGERDDPQPRDGFLALRPWIGRMEAYASRNRLPIRAGAEVTRVVRRSDGTFLVEARFGESGHETMPARSVVVASGIQRVPRLPDLARGLPAGIVSLHSADYRAPDRLPPGAVLVVGSGQSGAQIAEELVGAGRRVHLSASRVARVRRRYRGRDNLEWLVPAGFFAQHPEDLPDPALVRAAQPLTSGVGRHGHTLSLQWLERSGVRLLGHLRSLEGARLAFHDDLGASIRFGDETSAATTRDIERALAGRGIVDSLPPVEDDPADAPHPDPDAVRSPASLDLDAAGIGTVIWATGFGGAFDYLDRAWLDERGAPRHDGVETPVPGLYVLGFPWLTSRGSGLINGIDADAAALADALTRRLVA